MEYYSSNPVFWQFSNTRTPDEWKSKQAQALYNAAIAAERRGDDAKHAVRGSVQIEILPSPGSVDVPSGTPVDVAQTHVERHIAKLRAEADALERQLTCYGAKSFCLPRQIFKAPIHPFDAEAALISVLRTPRAGKIFVHGVEFTRDSSGTFREVVAKSSDTE